MPRFRVSFPGAPSIAVLARRRPAVRAFWIGTVAALVIGAIALNAGDGFWADRSRLLAGTAWLPSTSVGQIARVDGATAEVVAQVEVADPGDRFDVVPVGADALVVNHRDGSLRTVSAATFEVTDPVTPLVGTTGGLRVLVGRNRAYAVDPERGIAASAETTSLDEWSSPISLGQRLDARAVAVDQEDLLWAVTDTGDLLWTDLTAAPRRRHHAVTPGAGILVASDGPVLVDTEAGTAAILDRDTGRVAEPVPLGVRGDRFLLATATARRLSAATAAGELVVCRLDGPARCVPAQLGAAGLGTPVEAGNRVFATDLGSRRVRIADPVHPGSGLWSQPLPPETARFELVAADGRVFANDPGSNAAAVVDRDGTARRFSKYDPQHPEPKPTPRKSSSARPTPSTRTLSSTVRQNPSTANALDHEASPRIDLPSASVETSRSSTVRAGTVQAWGDNDLGQGRIPAGLTDVIAVSAGYLHSLALKRDGTMVAWGADFSGQASVPHTRSDIIAISAGNDHNLALTKSGTVIAWGASGNGQLDVPADLTEVKAIDAGWYHNLALTEEGKVVAWGRNGSRPVTVPADLTEVTAISAGCFENLALKQDGTVVGWSDVVHGALRLPPGLTDVAAISAGGDYGLALKHDGTVIAWYLYDGNKVSVPESLKHVKAISAGGSHNLALTNDGTVIAWGSNSDGQITVPTGMTNVIAVSAGYRHSLAVPANA